MKIINLLYIIILAAAFSCCKNDSTINKIDKVDVEYLWNIDVPPDTPCEVQPFIEEGYVYMVHGIKLSKVNLETGFIEWSKYQNDCSYISSAKLIADENNLYINHTWIRAFSKEDGGLIWEFDLPENSFTDDAIMDQNEDFLFLGGDNFIFIINKFSGTLYKKTDVRNDIDEIPDYGVQINNIKISEEGLIYAPFGYTIDEKPFLDGGIICYNLDCNMQWIFNVPDTIDGYVIGCGITNNKVVFSASNTIFALDKEDGSLLWKKYFNDDAFEISGTIHNDLLYVGSSFNPSMYCLDTENGQINWKTKTDGSSILNTIYTLENNLLFFCDISQIFIFNAQNGKILWNGFPPEYENDNYSVFFSELAVKDRYMVNVGSKKAYGMKLRYE